MIATNADNIKTWVDIAGTVVTSAAIVVGGLWAYFKFARNRTYRPRLEVTMRGRWQSSGIPLLKADVTVKNIGASVVCLRQFGSGLRVSRAEDPVPGESAVGWRSLGVFGLLKEHKWIEPGEAVSESMLLALPLSEDEPLLFETRLVWTWGRHRAPIVVFARQVMLPDDLRAPTGGTNAHSNDHGAGGRRSSAEQGMGEGEGGETGRRGG
jgi:hypothetical protein